MTDRHDRLQDDVTWRMLSELAHHQRPVLSGVQGMLDLLAEPEFADPDQRREYLSEAGMRVEFLLSAIDIIFWGTRVRLGCIEPWLSPFSPARLAGEVCTHLDAWAQRSGGRIRLGGLPPGERCFLGDAWRLQTVLLETCSAASGAKAGAEVVLSAAVQEGPTEPPLLVFEVLARGGDDAEVLADQLHRAPLPADLVSAAFSSGGMGLFLCRELMHHLGGDLDMQVTDGQCRFEIRVPAQCAPCEPEPTPPTPPPRLAGHVLVVEDNPTNRKVCEAMLRRLGASCESVASAAEVIARCAGGGIDAVLMDDTLPDMDGCTASRRIREQRGADAPGLPIIGLVMSRSDDERQPCAWQDAVLSKPVRRDTLAAALAPWIGVEADGPKTA